MDKTEIENFKAIFKEMTKAIEKITDVGSFHNRQVPALHRQTKALEFLREKREGFLNTNVNLVEKKRVLDLIDEVSTLLLST